MITLYSGTPGSGKSLYAAYVIYQRLLHKNPVIANFNINFDVFGRKKERCKRYFTWLDNSELTPECLIEYAEKTMFKDGKIKLQLSLTNARSCLMLVIFPEKTVCVGLCFFNSIANLGLMLF